MSVQRDDLLPIDEDAIDADLQAAVGRVELADDEAAVRIWEGFLAHASRPLAWTEQFARDKDNDLLGFVAEQRNGEVSVRFTRRIGVVEDGLYQGTIVSACRLTLQLSSDWDAVETPETVDEYGVTGGGFDAFREAVEGTPAFAALALSPVTGFRAVAAYG